MYMIKNILLAILSLVIVGGGAYYFFSTQGSDEPEIPTPPTVTPDEVEEEPTSTFSVLPKSEKPELKPMSILGTSVDGTEIRAYHYGSGDNEIVFIGGIHGGYSWNTALLGYELVDYFKQNPSAVPFGTRVTIIPALNPDGLMAVTGTDGAFSVDDINATDAERAAARFNANNVDLNRNFDCEWNEEGVWQSKKVSGGDEPFSEPESAAIKAYVEDNKPTAIVTYYSAAGGVYSSNCNGGVLPETKTLTNLYAQASGYGAHEEFDFYEITGDMVNWFAKTKIPAISVLLTDHKNTEWNKNLAGVKAVLEHYAEELQLESTEDAEADQSESEEL